MATNDTHTTPFRAVHPAEIIKDEIKARSMTQKELAERMGMQAPNVTRLLKGENITTSIAQKLEVALGIPADFWIRLQTQYDRDVKDITVRDDNEKAAIVAENMLSSTLNLAELYKRLKISAVLYVQEKLQKLEEFLGFKPLEIINQEFAQKLSYNYKKSDKSEVDEKNQTTWLTLAYIESRAKAPKEQFSQGNAQLAAHDIAVRAHSGNLREAEIRDVLSNYGITYSVVPKLEKTPIDAASMKVGNHPAIITTHRYNDMSRLVFNVLHELGHIEKHMYNDNNEIFVSGDSYSIDSPKEREANLFAQNMLISQKLWDTMMSSGPINGLRFGNIVDQLRLLSAENNLDFNIVVWRWKYESHNYQLKGTRPVPIQ
ncbi:MAG: helix-turn-helix domain-containing protein [Candidatus Cryptobacteroides sp.]